MSEFWSGFHYARFMSGAADDLAIAGWCAVMDGRQRAIELSGKAD